MGSAARRSPPDDGVDAVAPLAFMSAEEYWTFEQTSDRRHEFVNGVVYAMVGASVRHNIISGSLYAHLLNALPDRCQVFATDLKLQIQTGRDQRYYYPDVFVSCSPTDQDEFTRSEPVFVAEVLSRWTERTDRGEKAEAFRRIPTLVEYALIAQTEVRIELFRRRSGWQPEILGADDTLALECVDIAIPVATLYRRTDLLPPR